MTDKHLAGKRILFMAGGTGGHVIPGLTVAKALRAQGAEVLWLGTRAGIEARLVPEAGIDIHYVSVNGLRGKGISKLLLAPLMLLKAVAQAYRITATIKPDCVIGMGGFASGPGGLAAWLQRIPLVIHEQNAVAGTTNRLLARFSNKVMQAFPGAFESKFNAQTTGNPVRDSICVEPRVHPADQCSALRLLVLGGSLGAKPINDVMPAAVAEFVKQNKLDVWHQCGKDHVGAVEEEYRDLGVVAKVDAFIADMDVAYEWADVIVCRAGALTVSEVACAGKCAVFVPLPHAIDNHQYFNAMSLVEKDAAYLIDQSELSSQRVTDLLLHLDAKRDLIFNTGLLARSLAKPAATHHVIEVCLEALHV
jgi:UDP-N-acetylglucosamine--N-acetylmuramyl-(pentapeptide) pyrophosphoryl-undecaprenol N-acetylglucosamine transferase